MGVEMMHHYENLTKAMCKELERLDRKYASDVPEMAAQDVERADVLFHALKCAETYLAMRDAGEWDDKEGSERMYSGRRGRDAMGRYTSRDMYGYSGHYPDWMPPMYPRY